MTSSNGTRPAQPDADAVAAATLGCPGVVAMSGGVAGEVATYLPGRRVSGVRIGATTVSVHVVADYGLVLADLADAVRRAVAPLAAGRQVTVAIDDLRLPEVHAPEEQDIQVTMSEPGSVR